MTEKNKLYKKNNKTRKKTVYKRDSYYIRSGGGCGRGRRD